MARTTTRRDTILGAALTLFNDRGYAAATLDDVRRASGASVGSLYHHFPGKEFLAAELYLDVLSSYHRALVRPLGPDGDVGETIGAVVAAHFDWVQRHQPKARYLFGTAPPETLQRSRSDIADSLHSFRARLLAWLEPHVSAGRVVHLPDDVYEPLLLGPAQAFTRQWVEWAEVGDLARFAVHFADAAQEALVPAHPSRPAPRRSKRAS